MKFLAKKNKEEIEKKKKELEQQNTKSGADKKPSKEQPAVGGKKDKENKKDKTEKKAVLEKASKKADPVGNAKGRGFSSCKHSCRCELLYELGVCVCRGEGGGVTGGKLSFNNKSLL